MLLDRHGLRNALCNVLDVIKLWCLKLHQDVLQLLVVLPELFDAVVVFKLVRVVLLSRHRFINLNLILVILRSLRLMMSLPVYLTLWDVRLRLGK